MDKLEELVVEALQQAVAEPGEQRLFRSGKLPGLFPSRSGINSEAANLALRDGLLEIVRTESKGKTTAEWVKASPKGASYLHEHESPVRLLREVRQLLQINGAALPGWLESMQANLDKLAANMADETQRWSLRLAALSQRVEAALQRVDASMTRLADGVATAVPWGPDAVTYLFRRQAGGIASDCPLPELFGAVRQQHAGITIKEFHDGLKRLSDRGAVRLIPYANPAEELPEPEFALLDEATVYYFVNR